MQNLNNQLIKYSNTFCNVLITIKKHMYTKQQKKSGAETDQSFTKFYPLN